MRRRWAVPLSIALHAAVFYAIARVPWAASDLAQPPSPPRQVLWLEDWPRPKPQELALDPTEQTEDTSSPAEPQALSQTETVARSTPAPAAAPPQRRTEATVAPTPRITPAPEPVESRGEAAADASSADSAAPSTVPEVDWEKERHDAVRDVLEQRARERAYLTFSLDDLLKEPEPVEPAPPSLMVDDCVIVTSKIQRFMALMMGRCTREARSDLFAAIKPAYLKAHPVCIETRPESPGSFLSDGREISTVKCELVVEEE